MKTIIAIKDFCYKSKNFTKGSYFDLDKTGCHVTEAASLLSTGYLGWGEPDTSKVTEPEPEDTTKRKYTPRSKKDE